MAECALMLSELKRGETDFSWSLSQDALELDPEFVALDGSLRVELAVFREGDNVEIRGTVEGRARDDCARCGGDAAWEIDSDVRFFAMPASDEDEDPGADDDALLSHDGLTIELAEPIRQVVMLAAPMVSLCSESCLGLCPSCGKNLNEGACACDEEPGDPRWQALNDVLKKKKTESGSS